MNPPYRLSACLTPAEAYVRATGELDLCAAPSLSRLLGGAVASGRRVIRVDLAGVTFIDASCLEVFAGLRRRLDGEGDSLAFSAVSSRVRRMFALAGLGAVLGPTPLPEPGRSRPHLSIAGSSS